MSRKDYNIINWSEHFYLDSSSPSGLRWNRDVLHITGSGKKFIRYKEGSAVGSLTLGKNKVPTAWRTKLNGVSYLIHRIVWVIYYGSIDNTLMVDHLNGNPLDNSVENLELKTPKGNSQNAKLRTLNNSGVNGVCMIFRNDVLSWAATWRQPCGKPGIKLFSTYKYSPEEAFRLACEYRIAQIALLNENGANYTERHGSA
jgi:hypothetical protein